MLKIDLKDAYYSVKILEKHIKYLKFFAGSKLLKFIVLRKWIVSRAEEVYKIHKAPFNCLEIGGNHYSYFHR